MPPRKVKKKSLFEQLWSEATPLRKILTAAVSAIVLAGSAVAAWGTIEKFRDDWYVSKYGQRPHASIAKVTELEKFMEVLAQYTQWEINARQVQRQLQIDELRARCNAGRCSQYDRQSLNNLLESWRREQGTLEHLRRQQQINPQGQRQR